jgi:hypothetical protein
MYLAQAKPTPEQIAALEKAHKEQLELLLQANDLYIALAQKFLNTPKKTEVQKYGISVFDKVIKWLKRQKELEKYGVPKLSAKIAPELFFKPTRQEELRRNVADNFKQGKGENLLGVIPLIVWGAVLIVSAISAAFIVDEITTTAQEKADLLRATEETITRLGLTKEQAAALLQQTQEEASKSGEGITSTIKTGIIGVGAILGLILLIPLFTGKK